MPSESLEYETSCVGKCYVCENNSKVCNLLNGQVKAFLFCNPKIQIRLLNGVITASG